jgi:hypothetical protein
MHHRKRMPRDHHDHYLLLCDVTADTENTASSIVACWTLFTELLPGNTLIKSVTIYYDSMHQYVSFCAYRNLIIMTIIFPHSVVRQVSGQNGYPKLKDR